MTEKPRRNHFGAQIERRMAEQREREVRLQSADEREPEHEEIREPEPEKKRTWRILSEEETAKLRVKLRNW